ncbi:MAG: site-specific integrase [Elainellaceae cyanobacterium]
MPPSPGSDKTKSYRQRIPLGIYANAAGVSQAEAEARVIGGLLATGRFDWSPYLQEAVQSRSCRDWITAFERDYFQRRKRNGKSETTWRTDYANILKKLPDHLELTADRILQVVNSTEPDSKTRKRTCMALGALARFADIEVGDLKALAGSYSPSSVEPQELPSDELIQQWQGRLPNDGWRWAFGLLATYGIRPSELMNIDVSELPILTVLDGKTGRRRVWPLYPEWLEVFDLTSEIRPSIDGKSGGDRGHRIAQAFRRYGVPFPPKMLRHAWAVRSIRFGLDISLAAAQMGHSVEVHSKIYHRWISDRHHQEAFDKAMSRSDRPLPPARQC